MIFLNDMKSLQNLIYRHLFKVILLLRSIFVRNGKQASTRKIIMVIKIGGEASAKVCAWSVHEIGRVHPI